MRRDDEAVDDLVCEADPLDSAPLPAKVDELLAEMRHTLPLDAPRRRSRRWGRRGVAVATAAVLTVGGAGAAAAFIETHTRVFSTGRETDMAGPGEFLNKAGDDYPDVVTKLTSDIPFPSGYAKARQRALSDEFLSPEANARITTSVVRAHLAHAAVCAWVDDWAASPPDSPDRTEAVDALQGLLESTAVRDIDPSPAVDGYTNDQGLKVPTIFGFLPSIIDALTHSEEDRAASLLERSGRCGPEQVPHLDAGTVR